MFSYKCCNHVAWTYSTILKNHYASDPYLAIAQKLVVNLTLTPFHIFSVGALPTTQQNFEFETVPLNII